MTTSNAMTQENFLARAIEVHESLYDLSQVRYVNMKTKIIVRCTEHGETFDQNPFTFLKGQSSCRGCRKKKLLVTNAALYASRVVSWSDFLTKAIQRHGNTYGYIKSSYVNYSSKVGIICHLHKTVFSQRANRHVEEGHGCQQCHDEAVLFTEAKFHSRLKNAHNGQLTAVVLGNWKKWETKVEVSCINHPDPWEASVRHALSQGCTLCNKEQALQIKLQALFSQLPTHLDYLKAASSTDFVGFAIEASKKYENRYKYDASSFKYLSHNCRMECVDHGMFLATPTQHLAGEICPTCRAQSEFLNDARTLHGNMFDYSAATLSSPSPLQQVNLHCREHNLHFVQSVRDHLHGKPGCARCKEKHKLASIEAGRIVKQPKVRAWFDAKSVELHKGKYSYPNLDVELVAKGSLITITCEHDDHPAFRQPANVHLSDGERGAPGCQKCKGLLSRLRYRTPYPTMVELMKSWGFTVTATEQAYVNMATSIAATCNFNHKVEVVPQKIQSGHGCPQCGQGLGESVARSVLEARFGGEFKKRHYYRDDYPDFVAPSTRLEMDGYAAVANVGFEYQGAWHYLREMHASDESFEKQLDRDARKAKLFAHLHIPVFYIKEFTHPLTADDVRDKINAAMDEAGFDPKIRIGDFDLKDHLPLLTGKVHERISTLEKNQKVRMTDKTWCGEWAVYTWQCELCPNVFTAPFATRRIAKGVGCPSCARRTPERVLLTAQTRLTRHADSYLRKLAAMAKDLDLLLLDTKWLGSGSEVSYRFQCVHERQGELELTYNNLQKRNLRCKCDTHRAIMAAFRNNNKSV